MVLMLQAGGKTMGRAIEVDVQGEETNYKIPEDGFCPSAVKLEVWYDYYER